jgi:ectoine hydroxylase-related dioxygenase (phytanoyl-CoA dioxygenase family)
MTDPAREYHELGYTIRRGMFSAEEIDAVVAEIDRAKEVRANPSGIDREHLVFYTNLFQRSAALREFVCQPRIVDFLSAVVSGDLWIRWDQAVLKTPGGEEFPWHQDNGYNRLTVPHHQFWIALSDMSPEAGGLYLLPGSQKRGLLPHAQVGNHLVVADTGGEGKFVDARRGDAVLFSSLMLHRTSPNVSANTRWAYVLEYMTLDTLDPYLEPPYLIVARGGRPAGELVTELPPRSFAGRVRRWIRKLHVPGARA